MADLANDFKEALKTTEKEKNSDAILAFFGDEATLERLNHETYAGTSGAKTFWEEYLSTFKTQETTFHHTVDAADTVVLEWVSKGEFPNGEPFEYRGVSVLERSDKAENKVGAFRTYYDSAVFVNEGALSG